MCRVLAVSAAICAGFAVVAQLHAAERSVSRFDDVVRSAHLAKGVDKATARKFLDGILSYSQKHLEDERTSRALRTLGFYRVDDYVPGWYVVEINGEAGNLSSYLLVSQSGRVLQATPENCLQACRSEFYRQVWTVDAVKALCAKVLKGSHHGVIVSHNKDIPGYEKKPLPDEHRRLIAPITMSRPRGCTVYTFFAYEQLGGVVWQCKLTITDKHLSLSWETQEIARGIGNADYLL